jgi:hypothetical protein
MMNTRSEWCTGLTLFRSRARGREREDHEQAAEALAPEEVPYSSKAGFGRIVAEKSYDHASTVHQILSENRALFF